MATTTLTSSANQKTSEQIVTVVQKSYRLIGFVVSYEEAIRGTLAANDHETAAPMTTMSTFTIKSNLSATPIGLYHRLGFARRPGQTYNFANLATSARVGVFRRLSAAERPHLCACV